MNILAIDTSAGTSVAVLKDLEVLAEVNNPDNMSHAESVGLAIKDCLAEASMKATDIDLVVVGLGPGPFTGLRVGIVFAQTFGLARSIPVIGFCSLDAIACDGDEYIAVTDARRKEVYWARYNNGRRVDGPHVSSPTQLPEGKYVGEGAVKYQLSDHAGFPDLARAVTLSGNVIEPLYLRRPDAVPTAERS